MVDCEELGVIGRGMFGEAVLVQDSRTHEKMVVKHIPLAGLDEHEIKEALKEAKALRMLKHPNIVSFRKCWASDGVRPCVRLSENNYVEPRPVMNMAAFLQSVAQPEDPDALPRSLNILTDYVDGGSLDRLIARNSEPFAEQLISVWFAQMVMGVEHMHQHCILHRDIKPANIFITRTGVVKLGDLGSCKILETPNEQCTSEYGSPLYLGPEVWSHHIVTEKSDMWSLGCVVYELMSHVPPFEAPELSYKVITCQPSPLPSCYSKELCETVFERMLKKDPELRCSAQELMKEPYAKQSIASWLQISSSAGPSAGNEMQVDGTFVKKCIDSLTPWQS
ncbi:hypothetical protein AB1Y20_014457 [Prymnesium parvum]